MRKIAITCFILSLCFGPTFSQSKTGESKKYGHVEFVTSGAPAAQADFLDGLALLHDFEYDLAAAAFRRAEAADPGHTGPPTGRAGLSRIVVWAEIVSVFNPRSVRLSSRSIRRQTH